MRPTRNDARQLKIDARQLEIEVTGSGPDIVLLSGLGLDMALWQRSPGEARLAELLERQPWGGRRFVAPVLAEFGRVICYNRAGIGKSLAPTQPRGLDEMTDELRAVLAEVGADRPLLVGHSLGGAVALRYAQLYPQEVGGLLLIDSSHPNQVPRYRDGDSEAQIAQQKATHERYSREHAERPDFPRLLSRGAHEAQPGNLGNLPLTVLTSNSDVTDDVRQRHPHDSEADLQRWNSMRLTLQKELANLSGNSRHLQAHHCGHLLFLDDPELVIDSVRELLIRAYVCSFVQIRKALIRPLLGQNSFLGRTDSPGQACPRR